MVGFEVFIDEEADEFLQNLPKKHRDNVKTKLRVLETDPFPGKGDD